MGSALGLRGDFSALDLRALARRSGDAAQVRRHFGFGGDLRGWHAAGLSDGDASGRNFAPCCLSASAALAVPANITLLPLPPKYPAPDQVRGEPG